MPVTISRLRRWFAVAAIAAVMLVGGAYFYARHRVQNALKQVPARLGVNIQRSADGYTYSQSDQGRTIFKVQAKRALFKLDGRVELHDVAITLYGRDASRFDQIYGSDFEYDPKSGDVTAQGEVQIDLQANPAGVTSPDQATPKELKNPIHLKTSGLIFNQKTGDARTQEKVDFNISQAAGTAVGVTYVSKTSTLTLGSQVSVTLSGPNAPTVTANHGVITKDPRVVVLEAVHLQQGLRRGEANEATLFLSPEDAVQRIRANGQVHLELGGRRPVDVKADQLDLLLDEEGRQLRTATFLGKVEMKSPTNSAEGSAGRAIASFSGGSVLNHVRAEENVRLTQRQQPAAPTPGAQTMALSAPVVDFFVAAGKRLSRAETTGAGEIDVQSSAAKSGQTRITAAKFTAQFDDLGQLASVHGAPEARVFNTTAGQPDRVSTSLSVDATFAPGQGMETVVQDGNVVFTGGERKAWADHARYTPANQIFELSGSPRLLDQNMATTAHLLRMNRVTGEGVAEGDVKTTYNGLKVQPSGALLASSSPIHVTSHSMTMDRDPATAFYTGDVRLWQDANVVTAPSILFDRNHRSLVAKGSASQPVSTVLMETGKPDKAIPMILTSAQLNYMDSEREGRYTGGVTAKTSDMVLTSHSMDVFLKPENRDSVGSAAGDPAGGIPANRGTANLDHIVAQGNVVVTQPTRRATGDQLVYTAAAERFVLTGGPPSIFDAEQGKITGVSLTLFRADDRVLVEGTGTSPSVTQTRVAR